MRRRTFLGGGQARQAHAPYSAIGRSGGGGHDVIILALPHGASGALASKLDANAVVVDLGADHRLEEHSAWDEFYGGDFYEHWTYGMPELITGTSADGSYVRQREALPGSKRIA